MTRAKTPFTSCITRYIARTGIFSELVGNKVEMMVRKTAKDRNTVTEKDIFSPASAGITNTSIFR